MDVKTCKQCGELKPISQYRRYYGGRKGTYTMCKQCERINAREKYLVGKGESLNWQEEGELDKIHKLWEYQRSLGLQPPTRRERESRLTDDLDSMLEKYSAMTVGMPKDGPITDAPRELAEWLTKPLDREPDYYLDEVYEDLKETYRPVLRIDAASMMPVYDDKYKAVLDLILERFNTHEDNYYNKED